MLRPAASLLGTALLLSAGGCCSLARLFCGPDLSEWVQRSFETPTDAVRTFMEAARRDDAVVVFRECLSEDYKRRLKAECGGDTTFGPVVAWDHMKRQAPLHMLGYAQIRDLVENGDRAACTLDVEGRQLHLELVQQAGWRIRFRNDRGDVLEVGRWSLPPGVSVEETPDGYSRLVVPPLVIDRDEVRHPLTFERIVREEVSHEWKIDRIDLPKEPGTYE